MVPRLRLALLGALSGAPAPLSRSQLKKTRDSSQPGKGVAEREGDMGMYTQNKTKIKRDRHPKGTEREREREEQRQRKRETE
mgnify:CR=1 FL=1